MPYERNSFPFERHQFCAGGRSGTPRTQSPDLVRRLCDVSPASSGSNRASSLAGASRGAPPRYLALHRCRSQVASLPMLGSRSGAARRARALLWARSNRPQTGARNFILRSAAHNVASPSGSDCFLGDRITDPVTCCRGRLNSDPLPRVAGGVDLRPSLTL